MSSMKLPVRAQQEIKCYTQFALPLCAVFTEKKYHPWILKNFMEIKSSVNISKNGNHLQYAIDNALDNNLMRVDYNDVLDMTRIELGSISDPVDFVKAELEKGCYVHSQLNEFFLKEKPAYEKSHFFHPSLIYGYCDELNVFYAVGFIGSGFKEFSIGYEELLLAIKNINIDGSLINSNSHSHRNSYSYKLKFSDKNYIFNIFDLKLNLERYLLSPEINGWIYGMGGYNLVLENLTNPYAPKCYLKYNTTHLLSEHKKIFGLALEYIFNTNSVRSTFFSLCEEYKNIINLFENIRLIHMESILSERSGVFISTDHIANVMHKKITEACLIERDIIERILSKLTQYLDD